MTLPVKFKILLAGAANNAGLTMTQLLGSAGHAVDLASGRGEFAKAACSRFLRRSYEVSPFSAPIAEWQDDIAALAERERYDLIVPCNDRAMLLLTSPGMRSRLRPAIVAGPDHESLQRANDKPEALKLFREHGGTVPETVQTDDAFMSALTERAGEIVYPVYARTRSSLTIRDGFLQKGSGGIAADAGSFIRLMRKLHDIMPYPFFQPLIFGTGWGVEGVAKNGELFALLAHERLRETDPSGSYASAVRSVPIPPEVLTAVKATVAGLHWDGAIMFELKRDRDAADRSYLIEINTRLWGSLPLAIHCGVNIPEAMLKCFLDGNPDRPPLSYLSGVKSRLPGDDLIHLLRVLAPGRSPDKNMYPSRWKSLKGVCDIFTQHSYNRWQGDWRPGVMELWNKLWGRLR